MGNVRSQLQSHITVCIRLYEMALIHESPETQIISVSLAGNDGK